MEEQLLQLGLPEVLRSDASARAALPLWRPARTLSNGSDDSATWLARAVAFTDLTLCGYRIFNSL